MARYSLPVLKVDVALVGGTGIGSRLAALPGRSCVVPTAYGNLRGKIIRLPDSEKTAFLVQRHSAGHKTPPHAVNYKAIAEGVKKMGVKGCISTAASGCLNPAWPVGTVAICTDFIDATSRNLTMFEADVEHRDFTTPFPLSPLVQTSADAIGLKTVSPCTYLCVNGPRYETPAEIKAFRTLGADLVGMTAATEAVAMRESYIPYALVGIVTNAASGMGQEELAHEEVADVMETTGPKVVELLLHAAKLIAES